MAWPIRFCAGAIRYTIQIFISTVSPSHKALLKLLLSVGRRKQANIMIPRKPLFHLWTFPHHVSSFLHSGHSSQYSPRFWGSDINPESWSLPGTPLRCISHLRNNKRYITKNSNTENQFMLILICILIFHIWIMRQLEMRGSGRRALFICEKKKWLPVVKNKLDLDEKNKCRESQ